MSCTFVYCEFIPNIGQTSLTCSNIREKTTIILSVESYCLSKEALPILVYKLQYKTGQDFLDVQ